MHLTDEMLDHFLGHLEVGDDAVSQRADGLNIARRAAEHLLGFVADGQDMLAAFDFGERYDRGLVEDNAAAFDIDQRIRRPQIDGHVGRQPSRQS